MTALPENIPNLPDALKLAAHGYRVLPIRPGQKFPAMQAWQTAATCDPATIEAWWSGLYRGHGVAIATGRWQDRWLIVVDVDEHGAASGHDTLHDLETAHGKLPTTVTALTGSGGAHIYLTTPHPIRNDAGRRLGAGIDIRGEGGQVLAPPTIHPNGQPYQWQDGCAPWDITPAPAPGWLLEMLTPPTPAPAPSSDTLERRKDDFLGDSIADRYNACTTWADLLTRDGWVLSHTDRDNVNYWIRPGKDEGVSATTGWNGKDILRVFSTSIPWLADGAYSKFQYLAHRDHGGDMTATARAIAGHTPTTPTMAGGDDDTELTATTWEDHDLTAIVEGTDAELVPTILTRTDSASLIYPGRINMVFGESGTGKTWVALQAATQMIAQGRHVTYIDLEDHPRTLVRRLEGLGAAKGDIIAHLHYKRPEIASARFAVDSIRDLVDGPGTELVILDSWGEALALFGVDQNDDHGVAHFTQTILRPWTRLGAAVLLLDHIPKAEDSPKLFAIGSQRKRAAIDGAAYRVNQVKAFGRGVNGRVTLTTAKDRSGNYPQGSVAAEIDIASDGEQIRLRISPPEARDEQGRPQRPTTLMTKVSRELAGHIGELTKSEIRKMVGGKGQFVDVAVDKLAEEGYLAPVPKRLSNNKTVTAYRFVKPFDNQKDDADFIEQLAAVPPVPSRPDDRDGCESPQNEHPSHSSRLHTNRRDGTVAHGIPGEHPSHDPGRVSNIWTDDEPLF